MSIELFFAITIFFIMIFVIAVIGVAICYSLFEYKRNFIITEAILGAFIIIFAATFGSINVKFSHPEQINTTIITTMIVPDSETYKPGTILDNAHVTFVTSDNHKNIELITDYTDIEVIDDSQREFYEKTTYTYLFIKKQTDKLYITKDTYNRLFN
jgi:hypothetical protein